MCSPTHLVNSQAHHSIAPVGAHSGASLPARLSQTLPCLSEASLGTTGDELNAEGEGPSDFLATLREAQEVVDSQASSRAAGSNRKRLKRLLHATEARCRGAFVGYVLAYARALEVQSDPGHCWGSER